MKDRASWIRPRPPRRGTQICPFDAARQRRLALLHKASSPCLEEESMRFPGLIAACLAVPCALAPVRTETSAASVGGTPLTPDQERGLKPQDRFRECENCPEMVVVSAGSFTMGAPNSEKDRSSAEGPQHEVTIRQSFAAGQLHVTVDQFSAF